MDLQVGMESFKIVHNSLPVIDAVNAGLIIALVGVIVIGGMYVSAKK